MSATRSVPRPCPLCGNPTATAALVEAHVGPTTQHPKADVVLWLCPPCALEVTDPDQRQPPTKASRGEPRRRTPQRAPPRGRVGGRELEPRHGRTRPHRQPPPRKEVNRMPCPSLEELQRQVEEDGGCKATDGCFVEPDGTCHHGQPSWLVALGLI
jgi:hypothetical protein